MMRKKNNYGNKNRQGGGGRRYHGGHGNNRSGGGNDGQNITRQKHHAMQMREKYSNMARDAQNNGDRVDVEYYLQHVDHYTRVLTDIGVIEAERFAHQREQQAAQASSEPSAEPQAASSETPMDNPAEFSSNQPRMTRSPRHHNQPREGNGAQEANSNSTEIPLPGSILPII